MPSRRASDFKMDDTNQMVHDGAAVFAADLGCGLR